MHGAVKGSRTHGWDDPLLHAEKLNLEDEGGVRADFRAVSPFAVGQVRRHVEHVLGPHLHESDTFGPAGDDPVQRKGGLPGRLARYHDPAHDGPGHLIFYYPIFK